MKKQAEIMIVRELLEQDQWKNQPADDSEFLYKKYLSACHRLGIELQKAARLWRTKEHPNFIPLWFEESLRIFEEWNNLKNNIYPRRVWLKSIQLVSAIPEVSIQWDKTEQAWRNYRQAGGEYSSVVY